MTRTLAPTSSSPILGFAVQVVLLLLVAAAPALAQGVGAVASMEGRVDIRRDGEWSPARPGTPVHEGDTIRTGRPGRVRIVLRDESVINLGTDSTVRIDEQMFDAEGGESRSFFDLLRGKARTIVSDYYKDPVSSFRVQTKTAVSGVRGTEFIVSYADDGETTEVIGISGEVSVHGVIDLDSRGVIIGAQQITRVAVGGYPTPPRRLDDREFRQYLGGLEFIGAGIPEGVVPEHPVGAGAFVPPLDRIEALPAVSAGAGGAVVPEARGGGGGVDSGDQAAEMPDLVDLIDQPPAAVDTGDLGIRF